MRERGRKVGKKVRKEKARGISLKITAKEVEVNGKELKWRDSPFCLLGQSKANTIPPRGMHLTLTLWDCVLLYCFIPDHFQDTKTEKNKVGKASSTQVLFILVLHF